MAKPAEKPLVWLHGEIQTPPFTAAGRREAGMLLGLLQNGETPDFPANRPMPAIGPRCGELRIRDEAHNWRIVYRVDADAVLILDIFPKTTPKTPKTVIDQCIIRLRRYDRVKASTRKSGRSSTGE